MTKPASELIALADRLKAECEVRENHPDDYCPDLTVMFRECETALRLADGSTWVGLYQSEWDARDNAYAALSVPLPPVKPDDGAVRELDPWRFELDEVIGHLGAAIHQSVASDDQIIMDHVKAAHEIAKIIRRKA